MTRIDVEAIVENRLTNRTNMLQSQCVKNVMSTFEDTLNASYFNSNIGLKSQLSNVLKQALGEVVRCSHVSALSEKEVSSLV